MSNNTKEMKGPKVSPLYPWGATLAIGGVLSVTWAGLWAWADWETIWPMAVAMWLGVVGGVMSVWRDPRTPSGNAAISGLMVGLVFGVYFMGFGWGAILWGDLLVLLFLPLAVAGGFLGRCMFVTPATHFEHMNSKEGGSS